MDLNVLFAAQVEKLKECYAKLGHAPNRLQLALQTAVDNEVERSEQEIREAESEIAALSARCQSFRTVLGEEGRTDQPSSPLALLATIKEREAELERLQSAYSSRKVQVDKLLARIEEYRAILGSDAPSIGVVMPSNDSVEVPALAKASEVQSALSWCAEEVNKRSARLEEMLGAIAQLWTDLWQEPSSADEFDVMVLRHLCIQPCLVDLGQGKMEFAGVFEQTGEDDGGHLDATPTRKSGSERELSTQVGRVQRLGRMAPTLDNLAKASDRKATLETEREQRFDLIQQLYNDLSCLWKRFEVADEAVDEFVQENTGCTLAVIYAYERELKQMKDLKAEHMTLFISKVREDIAALWDQLLMTESERRDSLPVFFEDLKEGESGEGEEPTDELLALHEEKVKELEEEVAVKARPLEMVRQYRKLLDEAQELEASAKDTSRLMARGAGQKRDTGRLLREEKMRKRIKVLKPKIEDELLRLIPAWEEESGRAFCINGDRFLDSFDVQSRSPKKRVRTVSSTTAATPQMPPAKRNRTESAQASQRMGAPTPQSASLASTSRLPSSAKPSNMPGPAMLQSATRVLQRGVGMQQPQKALQSVDTNRIASNSSNGSSSSHSTDRTTIIHKPIKVKRRGPSLLLEQSFRHATPSKSDFARPCTTGAGASVRSIPSQYSSQARFVPPNESMGGANWAVLDEDEESNLLS